MNPVQSLSIAFTVSAAILSTGVAGAPAQSSKHAVFVMTNDAQENQIIAYARTDAGSLGASQKYATKGRGSGGNVDPLASQGSLTLSSDDQWLFAVNAGSGTVSAFQVDGSELELSDVIPTGGSEPNSVTQHGNSVYVLNTAGSSSVVGFYFNDGKFTRIPGAKGYLSANAVASGSVSFSPDGHYLLVTEKATNTIDVFRVFSDGSLSPATLNTDVGAGTFSGTFAAHGVAIVTETGPANAEGGATPNASAISSYSIQPDGSLHAISASVPTQGTANCWAVVTDNGKYVYSSNSASSDIAGFSLGSDGSLKALPGTVQASLPAGSINIDLATSGKFLYTLDGGNGSIAEFAINPATGALSLMGMINGLPASAGLNGIAAD